MPELRPDVPMSLGDHLHELRRRLMPPIVVFIIGMIIGFTQDHLLKELFSYPLTKACSLLPKGTLESAGIHGYDPDTPLRILKTFDLSESMWVTMSLAMWFGAFFAIPVFIQQLWGFIAVGLKARERHLAFLLVPVAVISFYAGAVFGFYIGMPYFFAWFIEWTARDPIATLDLRLASYRDDFFFYTLVFGFLFDIPWAVVAVVRVGFASVDQLAKWRKMAFFTCTIIAAIVAPPDWFSMLAMMIPTYLLFELGLLGARIIGGPKKANPESATGA